MMRRLIVTACLAVGLTAVGAAPAYAVDGLTEAKRVVTAQIDGRLAAIRVMSAAVNEAQRLTASHKATLKDLLATDATGLTNLKAKVAGETTLAGVRADAASMVNDYRIYLLVVPKVHLTHALDLADAAIAVLRQVHDRLAAAIAAAKQAGKNVGDAEARLADLSSQLTAAAGLTAGRADTLLAIKPGPDAEAIKNALRPIRDAVHTARRDLRAAVADARAVRDILKGLGG
jgi:hypothetical protein